MDEDDAQILRRALLAGLPAALFAEAAQAQNAARIQPHSYRVTFENAYVRVLDYTSRPGMGVCGDGLHSHPAHLTVPLSPGKARVKIGGKTMVVPAQTGGVFWEDAVTHEVENVSGASMRALIIELKSPALRA